MPTLPNDSRNRFGGLFLLRIQDKTGVLNAEDFINRIGTVLAKQVMEILTIRRNDVPGIESFTA